MTDYKATPEQWAAIEKAQVPVEIAPGTFVAGKDHVLSVIILELRARVAALEANSKPTSNLSEIRSSLVERVMLAIDSAPIGTNNSDEARAAILVIADAIEHRGAKRLDLDPAESADWLRSEAADA